jgi:glycosyltransferase involved in cell wall biosynthesis
LTKIVAILWSGVLGGAETFTVELCRAMRDLGAEVGVVFVTDGDPLGARLDAAEIPHTSLGLRRGRHAVLHPRRLARCARALGPDGALVPRAGYLTAALRAGGYRGRVVAVAHDAVYDLGPIGAVARLAWRVDRATGFWASDVDVAVSDFALSHMRRQLHARRVVRIYNGVDLDAYANGPRASEGPSVTIASAARLIEGKGIDVLLRALATNDAREGVRLRIAGEGPTLPMLRSLTRELGLIETVEFTGSVADISSFWNACDIAVQPSDTFVESFGMAAVEAMACGRPVIATANGALPEVVEDGVTGTIVTPGDVAALADALLAFTRDPAKRRTVGLAARARCEQHFDIRKSAGSYLSLFRATKGLQ